MKYRPILFSGPMVRALLDGTKTQTRRVMSAQPDEHDTVTVEHYHPTVIDRHGEEQPGDEIFGAWWADGERGMRCPYGQPGDRLWVREAWRVIDLADCFAPREITAAHRIWFEADGPHEPPAGRYRPGMFMPRWASRITLEITGVRVERLQDISDEDSLAEGVYPTSTGLYPGSPRAAYQKLWEQINGPGSWDANPWVWVVEFKRVER